MEIDTTEYNILEKGMSQVWFKNLDENLAHNLMDCNNLTVNYK